MTEDKESAVKQWTDKSGALTADHWSIEKIFRFEAAHALPNHEGKCQRLHGHSWCCTLILEGEYLQREGASTGMVMDFGDLKEWMGPLLKDQLDHCFLNETTGLKNPTSEALSRWIYHKIAPNVPQLVAVKIDETCTCGCEYRPVRFVNVQPAEKDQMVNRRRLK